MDMSSAQIENIVRQVLAGMNGSVAPATNGDLPKTAHVAMLVDKKKFEVKEFPIPELTDDDILVCDPEREYGFLREFGAEIIHIAAGSDDHINAMDMVEGYSDTKNPIAQKSQFIMSLLEQLDQTRELTSIDKSIIDRCTGDVYRNYRNGGPLPFRHCVRCSSLSPSRKHAT